MAKKINTELLTNLELDKLEKKVEEFQTYLELNSIIVNSRGFRIDDEYMTQDGQDKLHKEIAMQIKMQDALFAWIPALEKLRQGEEKTKIETRGDIEINGLFQNKMSK